MPHRIERANSLIRQEISELLLSEIKDPRLDASVTITGVTTSADLRHTRVFISRTCTETQKKETMAALTAAAGFLRNKLAKRIRLRHIPELSFQWDESIERGDHLLRLIDEVSNSNHPEYHRN
ncbi:30S ribosome-binding factor RbfA [Chloroflexota bacterium]